jgi:hypothetical protein
MDYRTRKSPVTDLRDPTAAGAPETPPRRLFDVVRERLRTRHYSLRTERAYLAWIRRYVAFHERRHPREMGGPEVEAFQSHHAVAPDVAARTQNKAQSARQLN